MKLAHAGEKNFFPPGRKGTFRRLVPYIYLVTGSDIDDAEKDPQNGMEEKQ